MSYFRLTFFDIHVTIRTVATGVATTFATFHKEPTRENPQPIFNRVIQPFNQRLPLASRCGGGCSEMHRAIINGLFDVGFGHRREAVWTNAVSVGHTAKNSRVGHAPACARRATRAVKSRLALGAGFSSHFYPIASLRKVHIDCYLGRELRCVHKGQGEIV